MKLFIVLLAGSLYPNLVGAQGVERLSAANLALSELHKTLQSFKSIRYKNVRELNYASENYRNVSKWASFYDFSSRDTVIGFKYQVEDSTMKSIFNGTESFDLNKKVKSIEVNDHPTFKNFERLSFFYNSIITLRNILPLIISDETAGKTISDTVIGNTACTQIIINVGKRRIQNLGTAFDAMQTKASFIYKVTVRKDNHLPYEVVQTYDISTDFIKTTFAEIDTNPTTPSDMSWYYSTYMSDYKKAVNETPQQLLSVDSFAPQWRLQTREGEKSLSLSDLKGQIILLDFWIKNCGPCLASMPHLNMLQSKFGDKKFKVISINSYDSKTDVDWITNKFKTNYTVLLNGKSIAEKYGVNVFPTFFILDSTGKVLYVNTGYSEAVQVELEKVIQTAL